MKTAAHRTAAGGIMHALPDFKVKSADTRFYINVMQ